MASVYEMLRYQIEGHHPGPYDGFGFLRHVAVCMSWFAWAVALHLLHTGICSRGLATVLALQRPVGNARGTLLGTALYPKAPCSSVASSWGKERTTSLHAT